MALAHTPHTVSVINASSPSELEARENEKLLQVCHDSAQCTDAAVLTVVQRQLLSLC